jgi:hypothetical protein
MLAKGVSCDGGRLPASVSPASLTGELARGADAEWVSEEVAEAVFSC